MPEVRIPDDERLRLPEVHRVPASADFDDALLAVVVPGKPKAQGSMNVWVDRKGTGRASSPRATLDHRAFVAARLAGAWGLHPIEHSVRVECLFSFARPKNHYGSGRNADVLKDGSPVYKSSPPDLDKLLRLVGDALTQSGVVKDDSLIVEASCKKVYGGEDFTLVAVWKIDN
jgi:crossover junction endodeoxyribonuclease RusA